MKQRLLYILLMLWCVLGLRAEVVVLRSGYTVKGEILLSNDEVLILRKKDGTRYQYPQSEVAEIKQEDTLSTEESSSPVSIKRKPMAVVFSAAGGTSHMPNKEWGGYTHIEMLMGTHQIQDKRMVIGGSIAYHGVFRNGQSYSWIPLQMALQIPLLKQAEQKHAPVLGGSIGYAIATNKNYGGGITAGVDVGWWYSISPDKSLSLSLSAKCLQTEIQLTEQLNGTDYQNRVGCTLMNIGLKLGIQL